MPRYAAVDIGSNSLKMQVAEVRPGARTEILADVREVTRLGESVFRSGVIDESTMRLVVDVLGKMAQIYQKHDVIAVRAVATSAVRDASNGVEFVSNASAAIGSKVEIISGQEEARLIYLGVEAAWPQQDHRVMVIDVGGGSGEIIVGQGSHMTAGYSRPLGAVRLTEMFLRSDPPTKAELRQLNHYIDEKLALVYKELGHIDVTRAIGTSATAAALVCGIHGIPRSRRIEADQRSVTTAQVRAFTRELSGMKLSERRKVTGIGPRRAEIIVAGASVFARVLEMFGQRELYDSAAGVRDGVIADLAMRGVGRELSLLDSDQRRTIESLATKFAVPVAHGTRVSATAHQLFECLQPLHLLPPTDGKLLEAACYLLDTGHYISNVSHHKHSAYVVQNADLPGFTERERLMIAMLCRYHRKAMPGPKHIEFQELPVDAKRTILYLTPLIRIADALEGDVRCQVENDRVRIHVTSPDESPELWGAEQAAKVFKEVYGIPVLFERREVAA